MRPRLIRTTLSIVNAFIMHDISTRCSVMLRHLFLVPPVYWMALEIIATRKQSSGYQRGRGGGGNKLGVWD